VLGRASRILLATFGLAAALYGAASLTGGWLGEPPWWTETTAKMSVRVSGATHELGLEQERKGRELISAGVIVAGLAVFAWAAWPRGLHS
jgi:hypothetical protein